MKKLLTLTIATWFGTGLIPPIILKGMAGTYGSLFSLPLCYLAVELCSNSMWGIISYMFGFAWGIYLLGLLVVGPAETMLGPRTDYKGKTKHRDQNQIVIDEVLGMLVTCTPMLIGRHEWWVYLVAFGLFRVFDIVKIWPTKRYDCMHSAFGVMMDDMVAGIYAALCLTTIVTFFNI